MVFVNPKAVAYELLYKLIVLSVYGVPADIYKFYYRPSPDLLYITL